MFIDMFGYYISEEEMKVLKINDLHGTAYIEFQTEPYSEASEIHYWRKDSIYFNLDFFIFLDVFIPDSVDYCIYGLCNFSREDSLKYIENMRKFIDLHDKYANMIDLLDAIGLFSFNTYEWKMYVNRLFIFKERIIETMISIIKFIKQNNYEFALLGV